MNIGMEDACETGLVLGLGRGDPPPKLIPSPSNPKLVDPSLTLGLSNIDAYMSTPAREGRPSSSPNSANSSFSSANLSIIKREIMTVNEEAERVSSRTSDEEEGGARKKLRLTKEQSALLENKFKDHTNLNPKQKQALARQLNLRPRQVEVWFQNRRARTKLKQTEVDCEVLKRCCETLSYDNKRLHKELEELKALKAPQMYMPMPATLTVCPSCERVSGSAAEGAKGVTEPFIVHAPKAHQFLNPFARSATC